MPKLKKRKPIARPRPLSLRERAAASWLWVRSWLQNRLPSLSLTRLRFWLAVLVVFAIPLVIYLPNTEYGYTKSILFYVSVSLLLIIWAIELLVSAQFRVGLTRLAWPALGVFGAAALSLINSENLALGLESLIGLLYFGLFGLMIANTVEDERDLKIILGALILSATIASAYGLLQYYGVGYLHESLTWLKGTPGFKNGSLAMISTFGNPNYLAGFLAHLLIPGCWLFLRVRSLWARLVLLLCLVLITAALVAANSVAAWGAALLAGLVFLVGILLFRLGEALHGQRRWALALIVLLGLTVWLQAPPGPLNSLLLQAAPLQPPSPLEQLAQWVQRVWEENSGWIRAWNWWIGYEMLRAHPFIGVGLGDYKLEFLEYKARFKETPRGEFYNFYMPRAIQAHNDYVQLAAELGMVGLIAIGFFLAVLISGAWRFLHSSAEPERRLWVLALSAGGVALMAEAFFSFPLHLPASEMNLVLFIALVHARPLLSPEPIVTLSKKNLRLLVSASAVTLAFVVTVFAVRDWIADLYLDTAEIAFKERKYALAQSALEQSVALDFTPGKALYYLGLIYAEQRQFERAIEMLERSLKGYPVENTYVQLAMLDMELKQYGRARQRLEKLLSLIPEPLIQLEADFMRRVLIPLQQGERDFVWLEISKFLQEHPDYARAYLVRGELHRSLGQYEAARSQYEQGLRIVRAKKEEIFKRLDEIWKTKRLHDVDELQRLQNIASGLVQMEQQFQQLLSSTR
ncbi:MAG: O-antigen ligase family protein [Candidatus Bipolaricaulota bacterium]|nr:O-antigen ligase family protein [Candidatus Bipolaricaulota bacterium]MCS7273923.1 O-antigen ligase family protein [Candidatus Bipolaricaulota bacterium]MDW8110790.1 O-antigen ligase family protein [Candidatus Bipolaricaulota bacterium]MDW8328729.1 O-antigen ligase family protein [Candidatus Bipolaricaulota bacterium]